MIINALSQKSSLDITVKAQALATEKVRGTEPKKVTQIAEEKEKNSAAPQRFDTFEKDGENSASKVSGIYSMGVDENGNKKIMFDKPKSVEEPSKPEEIPKSEEDKQAIASETTVNTDKVDAEIQKLQKEKQQVQNQLQSEENAVKRKTLEQRLKNLESELQEKDNDAYRKQHANYTMG